MLDKFMPFIGAIKAALAVTVGVALFGAGWHVNGWRLGEARANSRADTAETALIEFKTIAATIQAAGAVRVDTDSKLVTKLDAIEKGMKNAKPLPIDCRPDAFRVQQFTASIEATNAAIR